MQRRLPQVKKGSAFLIISCTLLVLLSFDLAFVPNSVWTNLFSWGNPNLATVLNPAVNYPTGGGPQAVFSADVNNDGKPDLVTANEGASSVSILLNNGTGGFGSPTNFNVGSGPRSVFVADLNNDGKQDLAVANSGSNSISILNGDGTGGFGAPTNFTVGSRPRSIFSADINNDGKQDLLVADYFSVNISILFNNGVGSFGAPTSLTVGPSPNSIFAADLNNDGKQDLVVSKDGDDTVSILLNNGTGGFGAPTNLAVGSVPVSVFASDLNNDGILDLSVVNAGGNDISILIGNGTGGFGAPTNLAVGSSPRSVFSSDLNNDGILDLAVVNQGSNNVTILFGNGTGGFGAPTNLAVGAGPSSVSGADFNGDGKQDLAIVNYQDGNVSILLSTPDVPMPLVGFSSAVNYPAGTNPNAVFSADFNNDGKLDIVTANGDNTVSIFIGNGSGIFASAVSINVISSPKSIFAADFNNDGKQDLVISGNQFIKVLLGNGNGSFPSVIPVLSGGNTNVQSIYAVDLNNDGKQDLAYVFVGACLFGCPYRTVVLFGNGDGTFSSQTLTNPGNNPKSIYAADLNNDGKQDLAVANTNSGTVSIYFGNGTGGFSAPTNTAASLSPISVIATDLNNDGKLDLAVANNLTAGTVSVSLNNGNGLFPVTTTISGVGNLPSSIFAADFNSDGKRDLAVVNQNGNNITVLLGDGSGGFPATTSLSVGSFPGSVFSGDFNNDGVPDLTTSNVSSNNISVLLGQKPNPIPTTTSIDQTSKTVGDSGFTLTVNGTNFINGSVVRFNGSARTTTYVSPTQLTANIPTSDLAVLGSFPITVFSPSFGSSALTTVDSHSESNFDPASEYNLLGQIMIGQSFNNIDNSILDSVKFYLNKYPYQSLTGNMYAKLYAMSGTYGINGIPTGPVLATSDSVSSATLPNNSPQLITFNFSGVNRINLPANTKYVIVLSYANGNDYISVGIDDSPSTALGNLVHTSNGGTTWQAFGQDLIFYVYGIPVGNESNSQTLSVNALTPTITSLSPSSAIAGNGLAFYLTVIGTNFSGSPIVRFNGGISATVYVDSPTQLRALILANATDFVGDFPVTVEVPGSGISNIYYFSVVPAAPTITSISPIQRTVGDATTTLTVTGTNFSNSSIVRWDGSDLITTYVNSTHLTAIIPYANMMTDGIYNISVFTPTPLGGDTSNTLPFTVIVNPMIPSIPRSNPNPVPDVFSIGPTVRYQGDPGFTLTVNGNDFVSNSVVRLNGVSKPTTFISINKLEATITTADILNPGSYPVTVFNPAPGGGVSTN